MAVKKFHIDLKKSFFIGDSMRDIQTGRNAGIKTILVRTGVGGGGEDRKFFTEKADYTVRNIYSAALVIKKYTNK